MAKARDIPELAEPQSFRDAAKTAVSVRAEEVFEHAEGVLDMSEIERVHDMRVATRRLRAVMEIFETAFPKEQHRAVLKDVKALADALGERRDRDVALPPDATARAIGGVRSPSKTPLAWARAACSSCAEGGSEIR